MDLFKTKQGERIKEMEARVAELKTECKILRHAIECVNRQNTGLVKERNELQAQLAELKEIASRLFRIKHRDGSYTVLTVDLNHLKEVLDKAPAQSEEGE